VKELSKKNMAYHAERMISDARLEIAGNLIKFTFRDGSLIELLVEEHEYNKRTATHYEKAMRIMEWLKDNGFATQFECSSICDRILRIGINNLAINS
jgi:hypothetical protein